MNIAWIGLGQMGEPMVRNLAAGTETVAAYNRTAKSVDIGKAVLSVTLADAVTDAEIVFLMLSDAAAVGHVLFAEDGVVGHAKPGTLIVNMSTIGVDETKMMAQHVSEQGLVYVDAPVSGSVGPAEKAQLVVLCGGPRDTFKRLEPLFARMAKRSHHLGETGSGAAIKLLVNAMLGVVMQVSGECIAAADKLGFEREQLLGILSETAVWAPVMAAKQKSWVDRDYPSAFALKHMAKDLGLMSQLASQTGISTPAIMTTLAMYLSAKEDGHADEDMAAIAEHMARLAGLA